MERRTRDSSPLSSYSFYLLVSMVTINTLQNTQRPSISYLSGYFKAIFQREATSGSKRSPSRRQTRGHTGRPPAICGPIGTAQSKHRAAPLALLHSFTPLSSCAIVARPFADTPGEIDPPPPDRDKGFKTIAANAATAICGHHLKRLGPACQSETPRRPSPACFYHLITGGFLVWSGKIFDLGLNAASVSKMLIRPEGGFFSPPSPSDFYLSTDG